MWPPPARRRVMRRALALAGLLLVALAAGAAPASAHNALESSDPADGAVLGEAPPALALRFATTTPLDTVGVELIGPDGARASLGGLGHGSSDAEVVAPLPSGLSGAQTVRWRLVGSDGHVVSGRVAFTVNGSGGTARDPVPAARASASGPATTTDEAFATPEAARWALRVGAFGSLVVAVGVVLAAGHLWPRSADLPEMGVTATVTVTVLAATTVGQLLVLASDVTGRAPVDAWGGIGSALRTDAGQALALRVLLTGVLAFVLFFWRAPRVDDRWRAGAACLVAIVVTWALAGHARSMRWPWLGVPLDVMHYGAGALWMGGLVLMVAVVTRRAETNELVAAVQRFARLAGIAVVIVVATGVLQAIRLVGTPSGLLDTTHGRLLAFKLFPLGAMLYVADVNRRRVDRRFRHVEAASRSAQTALRRAMTTESAFGAAILLVTGALVVSPPATSADAAASSTAARWPAPSSVELAPASAAFDRWLAGGTGRVRLQVDELRAGRVSTVRVIPEGSPASMVLVRASAGGLADPSPAEIRLDRDQQGFSGPLPLEAPGGWRRQVVVDGDEADSFVATLAVPG